MLDGEGAGQVGGLLLENQLFGKVNGDQSSEEARVNLGRRVLAWHAEVRGSELRGVGERLSQRKKMKERREGRRKGRKKRRREGEETEKNLCGGRVAGNKLLSLLKYERGYFPEAEVRMYVDLK